MKTKNEVFEMLLRDYQNAEKQNISELATSAKNEQELLSKLHSKVLKYRERFKEAN